MNKSINNTLYISNFINLFIEKKILILFFFLIIFFGYAIGYNFGSNNNDANIDKYEYEIRFNIKENRDFFSYKLNLNNNPELLAKLEVDENKKANYQYLSYIIYIEQIRSLKNFIYNNPINHFIDLYKDPKNKSDYLIPEKTKNIKNKILSEFMTHTINYDNSYLEDNIALIQFYTEDVDTALKLIEDYSKYIISLLKNRYIADFEKTIKNIQTDNENTDSKIFNEMSEIAIKNFTKEVNKLNNEEFIILNSENVSTNQTPKLSKIVEIGIASSNSIYYPIIFIIFLSFLYLTIIIFIYRKRIYNENN